MICFGYGTSRQELEKIGFDMSDPDTFTVSTF